MDFKTGISLFLLGEQPGKIVTQVNAHGQKVRDYDDPSDSRLDGFMYGGCKIWRGDFQKRRADVWEIACLLNLARQVVHAFIGLRHAASVGKEENPRFHLFIPSVSQFSHSIL